MIDDRVRWEDSTRNRSTRRPAARQNYSFYLLRLGRVHDLGILLLSHAAGELRSPTSSLDVARHRVGGDLHPPLGDVRRSTTVGAPVLAHLHAASLWEKLKPHGGLLLLA
jgi:hypothetical protein